MNIYDSKLCSSIGLVGRHRPLAASEVPLRNGTVRIVHVCPFSESSA